MQHLKRDKNNSDDLAHLQTNMIDAAQVLNFEHLRPPSSNDLVSTRKIRLLKMVEFVK